MKLLKKIAAATVLSAALLAPTVAQAATPSQVVVVNYEQALKASKYYQDAEKSMADRFGARDKELQAEGQALVEAQKKIETLKKELDDKKYKGNQLKAKTAELAKEQQAFDKRAAEFNQKRDAFLQEYQRANQEAIAGLERALLEQITTYAKVKKYAVVLDSRSVLHLDPSADITQELIDEVLKK